MSKHKFLDIYCAIGMLIVTVALLYWIFYWDIQALLIPFKTLNWSVLY